MQSQIREWQGSPDMDLVVQHSDSSSPLAGADAGRVRARRSGVGQAEPCRSDRADNRACVPVHATASVGARSGVSVWNVFRNERCQAFVVAYSENERCQAFVVAYSEKTTSKAGAASSAPTKSMSKPEKTSRNPLGQESFRGGVGGMWVRKLEYIA
jgi:hypothetical protein